MTVADLGELSTEGEATPLHLGSVEVAGGRRLTWTEWGDPNGLPVICQPHLGASGRRATVTDIADWSANRVRLIMVARAGLGASERRGDPDLGKDASDTVAIADALRIDRIDLVGHCGGSGAILALAATWPDRVASVTLVSPYAPLRGSDADTYLTPALRKLRRYLRFRFVARSLGRAQAREFFRDPRDYVDRAIRRLQEPDRSITEDPVERRMLLVTLLALHADPTARTDEWRSMLGPWKFDLSKIQQRVVIDQGALDPTTPLAMARWIASRLPDVDLRVDPLRGHLLDPAQHTALVADIAGRVRRTQTGAAADGSAAGG